MANKFLPGNNVGAVKGRGERLFSCPPSQNPDQAGEKGVGKVINTKAEGKKAGGEVAEGVFDKETGAGAADLKTGSQVETTGRKGAQTGSSFFPGGRKKPQPRNPPHPTPPKQKKPFLNFPLLRNHVQKRIVRW